MAMAIVIISMLVFFAATIIIASVMLGASDDFGEEWEQIKKELFDD